MRERTKTMKERHFDPYTDKRRIKAGFSERMTEEPEVTRDKLRILLNQTTSAVWLKSCMNAVTHQQKGSRAVDVDRGKVLPVGNKRSLALEGCTSSQFLYSGELSYVIFFSFFVSFFFLFVNAGIVTCKEVTNKTRILRAFRTIEIILVVTPVLCFRFTTQTEDIFYNFEKCHYNFKDMFIFFLFFFMFVFFLKLFFRWPRMCLMNTLYIDINQTVVYEPQGTTARSTNVNTTRHF